MESPARVSRLTPAERSTYTYGKSCFERGETDRALEALRSVLATRQNFADVHYMIGILLDRKGQLDEAESSLRAAIRLNPSYAEALLALATLHERRGDFERSRSLAERAASVSRGAPGALDATTRGKLANLQAAVGDAYAEAGERREAIEAYRKALDRCPNFHDIRHRLAVVLREAGLASRALLELHRVLRANPNLHDSRVQLGLTHYTLGCVSEAVECWNEVLRDDPSREDAQMYLRLVKPRRTGDGNATSPPEDPLR